MKLGSKPDSAGEDGHPARSANPSQARNRSRALGFGTRGSGLDPAGFAACQGTEAKWRHSRTGDALALGCG